MLRIRVLVVPVLACLLPPVDSTAAEPPPKARPAPVYTNDDLERVSRLREQTGVFATPPPPPAGAVEPQEKRAGKSGEQYWRREAERLRQRLWPLQEKARELRERIAERQRRPGVRPYTDPQVAAWQRRLAAVEQRVREMESELEDRARREGALPGWLR